MTLAELTALNLARWEKCEILASRELQVEKVAAGLIAPKAKAIYQAIAQIVWGKPDRWWFIAVVHEREASQNFACSIAQGDPWNIRSIHVPRGIGPFKSFADAAVFTLQRCAPYPAKWTDWSIGGVLTLWILYNGTGYEFYHAEPSPYDWGATNIEQEGKYVADGLYDASVWDMQVGCAAMLKAMMAMDTSIQLESPGA
jgi:lysozyme family protein